MGVNRDGDGDECFHDLLDFMYALQPFAVEGAPVARGDLLPVARRMVARGEAAAAPLREFRVARVDFGRLADFLLVMLLEGSEEDLKELPRDFAERRDKVMASFFGAAGGQEIDFLQFDEALSAGTSEIMGGEDLVTNEFVSVSNPLVSPLPLPWRHAPGEPTYTRVLSTLSTDC